MNKIAKNLQVFKLAVEAHDKNNPSHSPAYGIGMNILDLKRLDFEDGEELWSGVKIFSDDEMIGHFRVLCDGLHSDNEISETEKIIDAIGIYA